MEEARIKANKIKNIEDTLNKIRMIDFKPWSKRFTENDARSIIENAKNGEFDVAHKNIMKKIENYYKCDGIDYAFDIAAMRGHFNVVKYIVANSEDKNPSDAIGDTPLHRAAKGGHLAIVTYIMENIEDKSPKDQDGNTPLHCAAMGGHLAIVRYIMDKIEDKSPKDQQGNTPLHRAAMGGHLAIVRYIMDNIEDKSPKDQEGNTPLHYAASPLRPPLQSVPVSRKLDVFKYIFEHVDEKNPANLNGITPLHLAATQPEICIVKYILDNIEDRYKNDLPFSVPHLLEDKDERGWTSLHFAADSGQLKVFQYIMENVVDIPFDLRNVHTTTVHSTFRDFRFSRLVSVTPTFDS